MDTESERSEGQKDGLSALNTAIEATDRAKKISLIALAKAAFGTVGILLTLIRDSMSNEPDRVELGLLCANICRALDRGTNGKKPDELSRSEYDAINLLTSTVAEIQKKLVKWGKQSVFSRRLHAERDKETIATWRLDLDGVLQVFNNELKPDTHVIVSAIPRNVANTCASVSDISRKGPENAHSQDWSVSTTYNVHSTERSLTTTYTHTSALGESQDPLPGTDTRGPIIDVRHDVVKTRGIVSELRYNAADTNAILSDIHRTIVKGQEEIGDRSCPTSAPGEASPPAPRIFFGRDRLITKIVDFVEDLRPIALIGAGGIGKTSIALTILHDDRIKQRFANNRWFIRCDQFPASHPHFLRRLSEVTGANRTPLHPFLSSKEALIILDNADAILDPQGIDAQEIYSTVEELCRSNHICVCITSRISTIPPDCEVIDVPTLSMRAALDAFYRIYNRGERSDLVSDTLRQLDFHPLSTTLLATVSQHNKWDVNRLANEWSQRRTSVLHIRQNRSLAAAVEISLASPLFQELGPEARSLLGVIAFFPQGVDENNIDWLFPTIPDRKNIFDVFCVLSLTYRSDGFVTMLAPLRDYLAPKDPRSSSLLCGTKELYFARMSVEFDPNEPNFEDTRWIISEDVNVEHLLDVFTTVDGNSDGVWRACVHFMRHLYWHKKRSTVLQAKIEGLPDDNRSKPECLLELSKLFVSAGNRADCKRLLTRSLELYRQLGDDYRVARTLCHLSDTNRLMGLPKEGIPQAMEALAILERFSDYMERTQCLVTLASLLDSDKQFNSAEEAALRAINLSTEAGDQFLLCHSHSVLGNIYRDDRERGETNRAIRHYKISLGISSAFRWRGQQFSTHYDLGQLFFNEGKLDDAHAHLERAKSHTQGREYNLGIVMEWQASVLHKQHRLEEARSEVLRAIDIHEELGAAKDIESCRKLLSWIKEEMDNPIALYFDGIGWHHLAWLYRRFIFFKRTLRRTVVRCGFVGFRSDVYVLIAAFSLLVLLILPSQYSLSRSNILLCLCTAVHLFSQRY